MRAGPRVAVLCLVGLLAITACGDDEPLATPPTAESSPTATTARSSPSPAPSPSPSPLSAFEADPAVQALRAYLAAAAQAVNERNLQLPALLAASTARRAGFHEQIYGPDFGLFYPEASPVSVLGVQPVSETQRTILGCSVESGYSLDAPGGTPTEPFALASTEIDMLFEDDRWKVNRAVEAEGVSCAGVTVPGITP